MEKIYGKNISLNFGKNKILDNVDFEFNKNDFIGLIGPNGCGKSTLLKCIYKTLKQNEGDIYFDEKINRSVKPGETATELSVVSQHNGQSFDFKVIDMVLMGRSPYKKFMERDNLEDYEIARECLEAVDMLEFENRNFGSLSGGEAQRVVLARGLAQQTEFMILDEPTNHLDIQHQLNFLQIVSKLNKSCLIALHDLNLAIQFCNKIIVLKDGKVMASGNTDEVITEELINEVYNVNSQIVEACGKKMVMFLPKHCEVKIK